MRARIYKPLYIPRDSSDRYMLPLEEDMVGRILTNAAEVVADRDSEDGLERVYHDNLKPASIQTREDGDTEYTWKMQVRRDEEVEGAESFLVYQLEYTEETTVEIGDLESHEQEQLVALLREQGEQNEDLIDTITAVATDASDPVHITRLNKMAYICGQENLSITKRHEVDYIVNGESIMHLSDDTSEAACDDQTTTVRSLDMDLEFVTADDIVKIHEILYRLGLPGGKLIEDVTDRYVNDNYTYVD